MKHILLFGLSIILVLLLNGCGASNPIVASIGDEKITLQDFEENYSKNNGGWDTSVVSSLADRERFLDLLVKFKLKVKEARDQGLEKDTSIINEMENYNSSVSQAYMIEKEVVDPGVKELYKKKTEELRASHILFRLKPKSTPEDTLMAFIRAKNVIEQIPTVPFDTLAVRYSEDPSVKTNYGDLGYFSAGRMVSEFEDAAYSLKVGEVTQSPVRTQFGYHIIKLTAREPNPGSVRISHILFRYNEKLSDTAQVRDTAWMVYRKLKEGAKFSDMLQKYSQDDRSVPRGGDIGYYERDRVPPKVAEAFFRLKLDSVSEPMQFNYGFNIFKLTEKKPVSSFEAMQREMKELFKRVRYQFEYNRYLLGLRSLYHVQLDSSAVHKLISSVDSTKISGDEGWKDTLTAEVLHMTIIRNSELPFTINDFANRVLTANDLKGYALTPDNIWTISNKLLDVVALEAHARHATERYPELSKLLKEYEEGILLYRMEQDEVWKKVMVNDSLLREYYNVHKEEYRWPERVNFAEIYTLSDSLVNAAYKKIKQGNDFLDVAGEYTNRSGYKEKKGVWGLQPFNANDLARKASLMAVDSITAPFKYQAGWCILKTLALDSARVKSFEEATPEVSSGYQEQATKEREQNWVESLKKKYPVTVNKELLKEAFTRKRVEPQ